MAVADDDQIWKRSTQAIRQLVIVIHHDNDLRGSLGPHAGDGARETETALVTMLTARSLSRGGYPLWPR